MVWQIKSTFDQKTRSGFVASHLNTKDFCGREVWKADKKESSLRKLSVCVKYFAGTSAECGGCIWYPTGNYRFLLILSEEEIGKYPLGVLYAQKVGLAARKARETPEDVTVPPQCFSFIHFGYSF